MRTVSDKTTATEKIPGGKIYIASGLISNEIELMKKDSRLIAPRKN